MKNGIVLLITASGLSLLFQANRTDPSRYSQIPEQVSSLLVSSCHDCHTTGSKSADAAKALEFNKWDNYKVTKKVALLGDICEMLEKGKMPPQKYLDGKPEAKLSEEQKQIICDWTKEESDKLMDPVDE